MACSAVGLMQVNVQQEHSELSELMGDFGLENAKGKGIAADHAIEQQFAQSEYDLKQANERVTAVNDAIRELQHLEDFIRSTKPSKEEAVMLTEEITRQLLEKMNFLRLDFAVPSTRQQVKQHVHLLPIQLPALVPGFHYSKCEWLETVSCTYHADK